MIKDLSLVKQLREHSIIKIATHNGRFHDDELCALAILKEAIPDIPFNIVRTRDPEEIASADIVIDVGGGRFDHHFSTVRYPNKVPMASCGKILAAVEPSQQMINILNKMSFYAVQCADNGERQTTPRDCITNYFDWVSSFNPTYEERTPSESEYYDKFIEAYEIVRRIYRRMRAVASAQLNSFEVLNKAPTHVNNRFIELPTGGIPWYQYLTVNPNLLGVIFKDIDDGNWKVRVAPVYPGAKEMKVYFPASWGGLTDQAFEITSKIQGAVFCHLGLFLASFKTKEGALTACRLLSGIYSMQ